MRFRNFAAGAQSERDPTGKEFRMRLLIASCLLASAAFAVDAQDAVPGNDIRNVAPVLVTASLPGPGLWKVAKGDHAMWVLGTQSPLPRHMQWHSREVDDVLATSQEVIYAPVLGISVDTGGFFRSLLLVPKMYGARKNPDGKTLREVLPAGLYARWLPLRERYLGRGRSAERMRPLFAAEALWDEAIDDNDLTSSGIVGPVVERAVKVHGLRQTRPKRMLQIKDPKALLAEIEHEQLDDTRCMALTLQRLEAGPEHLKLRADAWAVGDLAALRALPDTNQREACAEAAMESPALRKRGGQGIDEQLEGAWLEAAEQALANNRSTFALLPISNLLSADGYLARLAARGYQVTPPE